jgi:error-prone DNA polymerase
MPVYAELQATTNFSFLRGASHPEELVARAHRLGLRAIAVTDRNSLAGVVRAHGEAKARGIRLVVGARLDLRCGTSLLCFPEDRAAYGRLCRLLTRGKRRAAKGQCDLGQDDLAAHAEGQRLVLLPGEEVEATLGELAARFPGRLDLAASFLFRGDDRRRIDELARLADRAGVPLVATGDVLYHDRSRRPLQDILTCIREHCTIDEAGYRLLPNAERHLKPPLEMARLFRDHPEALTRSVAIADACRFSLDELRYDYPIEPDYDGLTPQQELARRAAEGAARRYPAGVPDRVRELIDRELGLIARLDYAPYFLTVDDIVRFARSRGILCQGRGSAANSAVCYCLGVTAVDPERVDLLFERFVSAARGEPPDIDVDLEHERREEVIQHVYARYGRGHAGLAATVIRYRARSAVREVGKAMGLSLDAVGALAKTIWGWSGEAVGPERAREAGLDADDPTLAIVLRLTRELIGFPRHLSQHVGGFVISRSPLEELVPIENAAMDDRTVVAWDKDDLEALGMLKIDLLGLGMLSCIRKAFELLRAHAGLDLDLASVPEEDPAVYDMLCRADSIGVFQVESRAQMAMLPRLRPRCFYDLVIEVAIVRPGPIQGDMVHPYLRRRSGQEPVSFPSEELRRVLGKTMGVPLFQEQAMRIAMVAAGFTAAEADQLRRSMAAFRRAGEVERFRDKLVGGMVARGYARDFAERCFKQIEGFGYYGFPESHAASFALLVYVSAWLKCHHPAAFACALLNSQPMGFYAPAQIVRDAREHGVEVRPVDVGHSDWDCTLEKGALRLGLRMIKGLAEADGRRLVAARPFRSPAGLQARSGLGRPVLERLARADGFRSLGLDRRGALWAVKGLDPLPLLEGLEDREPASALPAMSLGENVVEDYTSLHLSLKAHPCGLLRPELDRLRATPACRLAGLADGARVAVAGLVLVRQRPGSAKGVIFMTLEDETGFSNCVVWARAFERFRKVLMTSTLLMVRGRLQREGEVVHVVAEDLRSLDDRLALLLGGRGGALARADEVRRPARALPDGRNFR